MESTPSEMANDSANDSAYQSFIEDVLMSYSPEVEQLEVEAMPSSQGPVVVHVEEVPMSNGKPPMPEISTLIFFDLETTGLPKFPGDSNVQITELSFLAVAKEDFEKSKHSDLHDVRVMNKITLCIKPRCYMQPGAAKVTGLSNELLRNQTCFDQYTSQMIFNFIKHLPQPCCLVAHNGNCFDFPLLKSELQRFGVHLPETVLTADTLIGCRLINPYGLNEVEQVINAAAQTKRRCKEVKVSFALQKLYKHFFKRAAKNRHSSEGDCVCLMMVCHKLKDKILPWMEENKGYLHTITPMW